MTLPSIAVKPRKSRFNWPVSSREGVSKPCAGYVSQTAAVWAMHAAGLTNMEIRTVTGLTRNTIARAVFEYRRKHGK